MQRLFGTSKPAARSNLQDCINSAEDREEILEKKINKLNAEIKVLIERMNKARSPSEKQKATRLLKQRKSYEQRLDQSRQQVFNMEQINFTQSQIKDSIATADAMRVGAREMKYNLKKINVDKLEVLQDDMEDMMEQTNEMQEIFARSYNVPEVDEEELEAEFLSLGQELTEDPTYLDEALAPPVTTVTNVSEPPVKEQSSKIDEFGLPLFK